MPLFLIIYLFRKCLSRKTCRDGTFHISLAPGIVALEKKMQQLHHPWRSSTEWKTYPEKNSDEDWERVGGRGRSLGGSVSFQSMAMGFSNNKYNLQTMLITVLWFVWCRKCLLRKKWLWAGEFLAIFPIWLREGSFRAFGAIRKWYQGEFECPFHTKKHLWWRIGLLYYLEKFLRILQGYIWIELIILCYG